jgi:hypothetical protein
VNLPRPPLETLACTNPTCQANANLGNGNLTVRKTYGRDRIRYLRRKTYGYEFSERKNTALWNTKISETQAATMADCLANKNSPKATVRISNVSKSTVIRLHSTLGVQAKQVHDKLEQNVNGSIWSGLQRWLLG